ncbi:MAG: uroporphyrinogen-III C-methyltransferase [Planctomycetes bacterium]|nr:uroporphyrinogen-III C-methyltransferase [Planctomycetota bacterium]
MSVALVGAGPGDPGLLTVRAAELLREADCVIHDYLVSRAVLALIPASAVRHDVGKRGHSSSLSQAAINALLLECARRYARVVRLKGGDPFVFGRGGEEAQALAEAGIPFEIVPGITSGIAVPAYAGIPITHRASSASVAFIAGHLQEGPGVDWAAFARVETLVLYMGMQHLDEHCAALIAHGRDPETPAATIQWGTLPAQRTVVGTLRTLPARVRAAGLGPPAITVIGEVVRYRERIRWFDHRPLFGRRVLVTRASEQAGRLAAALAARGAEVISAPLQRFVYHAAAALAALPGHEWLAFASANAVEALWRALEDAGRDARALAPARLAAIGPGTAEALRRRGLRPELVAAQSDAAGLAEALGAGEGRRVLLPQAAEAAPELAERLRAAGWQVTAIAAYHAEPLPLDAEALGVPDAITVASAASVERLRAALGAQRWAGWRAQGVRLVAIGPRTAEACARCGWPAAAVAATPSAEALAEAVRAALAERDERERLPHPPAV